MSKRAGHAYVRLVRWGGKLDRWTGPLMSAHTPVRYNPTRFTVQKPGETGMCATFLFAISNLGHCETKYMMEVACSLQSPTIFFVPIFYWCALMEPYKEFRVSVIFGYH